MLKMMVPLPAVQQQMLKDGLEPDILDQDHNLPYKPKPLLREMEEVRNVH